MLCSMAINRIHLVLVSEILKDLAVKKTIPMLTAAPAYEMT